MANALFYSNTAQATTLSGSISAGATSVSVGATTGFPSSTPYVLALDFGGSAEELVLVTAVGGTTLTVTRAYGGTSAQSHSLGAVVRHVYNAVDATDFRTHEAATAAVHGVAGTLVGTTDTQTLTNKTLTAPTVNTGTFASGGSFAGTFTGTPTFSGALTLSGAAVLSGTPSISNGAALAGTFTGSPAFSGAPTFSGAPLFTGGPILQAAAAATTAASVQVSGDSTPRLTIGADGKHSWGPGNAATDTTLYRSAANKLEINQHLNVVGDISGGNLQTGSWVTWVPSWTTSTGLHTPSYGNAGQTFTYVALGKTVIFKFELIFGSTTDFGSGATSSDNWRFSLPATAAALHKGVGYVTLVQSSNIRCPARMVFPTTSTFEIEVAGGRPDAVALASTGTIDSLTPWTWANGHGVIGIGCYEAA